MHRRSILYDHAPKHCAALNDQPLDFPYLLGIRVVGLIAESAENARPFHLRAPVGGDADFASAEYRVDLEHRGIAGNSSAAKVQFEAPENCGHFPPPTIRRCDGARRPRDTRGA